MSTTKQYNKLFKYNTSEYNTSSNTTVTYNNNSNIKMYMNESMSYWEKYLHSIKNKNLNNNINNNINNNLNNTINIRSKL